MSDLRIAIFGDGEFELGQVGRVYSSSEQLPALPCLVHRLLGSPVRASYVPRLFRKVLVTHRKLDLGAKAKQAIRQAEREGYQAVVIVIDRDRQKAQEKNVPLARARDAMAESGFPPCAVGVAVETFDAWMIVDGGAVQEAGGDGANCHGSPEGLAGKEGTGHHPKDWAARLLGGHGGLGAKYAIIASKVDLNLLEKRCPDGFADFAQDTRKKLLSVAG